VHTRVQASNTLIKSDNSESVPFWAGFSDTDQHRAQPQWRNTASEKPAQKAT